MVNCYVNNARFPFFALVMRAFFVLSLIVTLVIPACFVLLLIFTLVTRALLVFSLIVTSVMLDFIVLSLIFTLVMRGFFFVFHYVSDARFLCYIFDLYLSRACFV